MLVYAYYIRELLEEEALSRIKKIRDIPHYDPYPMNDQLSA
ncbi:15156_t:CDS:2, partial [Racocetra persica]